MLVIIRGDDAECMYVNGDLKYSHHKVPMTEMFKEMKKNKISADDVVVINASEELENLWERGEDTPETLSELIEKKMVDLSRNLI